MTAPAGAGDYFTLEAGEYVERLDALLAAAGGSAPDTDAFARQARALRGSAAMARHTPLAELAGAIEAIAIAVRDGRTPWSPALADAVTAAVDAFKALLRRVREWSDADGARAAARTNELRTLAGAAADASRSAIVPIARLFHDDDGPHVVHRNPRPPISADLRFRQAALPLASTLRRLIDEARHATDDAARRAVGEDLRAALRDLGELAESHDIAAVASFARAREATLGTLDERALDVVDAAAQSLVESASTVWARPTPPASVGVIAPAPTATEAVSDTAAPAPPVVPTPRHTPASGQALVALLETSITGLHAFVDEAPVEVPHAAVSAAAPADRVVSIDALLYRGRSALDRARAVRDALRGARGTPPDPQMLDELYDLLDLAATEEPLHA